MEHAAHFERVSKAQFEKDWQAAFPEETAEGIRRIYEGIILPRRATKGSAGYDIFAPAEVTIAPGHQVLIPTGIRVKIKEGYVLMLFPRSGLGFKYRLQLNNTVGIIDSDYYHADNEGHIFCKLANDSLDGRTVTIAAGTGMVQGVFVPFGITADDDADAVRTGGLGSTTKETGNNI